MAKKKRPPAERLPDERVDLAVQRIQYAVDNFQGTFDELESAVGMYMLGHYVGWRVLVLMHSKATIRKYEKILGIEVRSEFEPEGSQSERSIAYGVARTLSNFWKVVSGESKLDVPKDDRKRFS